MVSQFLINSRYGLRTARIYGGVLLTLAFVFYYFLSYSSHLLWFFWIFLCMGTLAPLLTLLPLANSFPERKGMIITIINGVYDCSVAATAFWAGFYENGMSVSTMAIVLLLVMGFYWIRSDSIILICGYIIIFLERFRFFRRQHRQTRTKQTKMLISKRKKWHCRLSRFRIFLDPPSGKLYSRPASCCITTATSSSTRASS